MFDNIDTHIAVLLWIYLAMEFMITVQTFRSASNKHEIALVHTFVNVHLRMDLVVEFGGRLLIDGEAHAGGHELEEVVAVPVKATQNKLKLRGV